MPVVTQQVKEAGLHTTSSSGHHGFFLPISFQCLTFKARPFISRDIESDLGQMQGTLSGPDDG